MSSTTPYYFRRRTIGRAASPPAWACYEQIPYDEDDCSDSASDSCSEDGEDYPRAPGPASDSEESDHHTVTANTAENSDGSHDMDIDMDMGEEDADRGAAVVKTDAQKDVKGKQRAIDPEPETTKRRHRKKQRQPVYTLRPILTIQRSQGFVWNQVSLFASFQCMSGWLICPINRISLFLRISKTDVRLFFPTPSCTFIILFWISTHCL